MHFYYFMQKIVKYGFFIVVKIRFNESKFIILNIIVFSNLTNNKSNLKRKIIYTLLPVT